MKFFLDFHQTKLFGDAVALPAPPPPIPVARPCV